MGYTVASALTELDVPLKKQIELLYLIKSEYKLCVSRLFVQYLG